MNANINTIHTNNTEKESKNMNTTNINIKTLLGNGEMQYDHLFTEGQFQWFKSDANAYIYVLNTETKRATRYNAEAQNGKRISVDEFESNMAEMFLRIAKGESNDEITAEDIENDARELERYMAETPAVLNEHGMVDCSKCPIKGTCIHHDAMRRNPENVGGLGLCPRLKIKAEEPKVIKRTNKRVSKNTAWGKIVDGVDVSLTSKQVDFMKHLPDTCFWEEGLDSVIWVDCLCDDIQGQFAGKPMTVGAMISTLCEKGLGTRATDRRDGRKCTSFELTELGKLVAAELGLQ